MISGALAAAAVEQGVSLSGLSGHIDLLPQAEETRRDWQAWRVMPEPRFSEDHRFNLPWLSPGGPPFVLAFNYGRDRQLGFAFEKGGMGGLISSGYFRSLVVPAGAGGTFDGASLEGYRARERVGAYVIYERVR